MGHLKRYLTLIAVFILTATVISCDDDRDTRYGYKTYNPGTYTGTINSFKVTADGGYIAVGTKSDATSWSMGHPVDLVDNIWVTKTDSTGNIQWEKAYSNNEYWGYNIEITPDGGYLVMGHGGLSGHYWILKLTAEGAIQWQKIYNNTAYQLVAVKDMRQTADGGYILACSNDLLKLDSNGNIVWAKTLTDPNYAYSNEYLISAIKTTADGTIITAGAVAIPSADGSMNSGWAAFAMAFDSNGNIIWNKKYHLDKYYVAINCIEKGNDGYYFSGSVYQNFVNPDLSSNTVRDMLIMKIETNGNIAWMNKYDSGAQNEDELKWIEKSSDGNLVAVGRAQDSSSSAKTIVNMKINSSTGAIIWQNRFNIAIGGYADRMEMHEDSLGYVVNGKILDYQDKLGGMLFKVNKDGTAPGADFIVNCSIGSSQLSPVTEIYNINTSVSIWSSAVTGYGSVNTKAVVKQF